MAEASIPVDLLNPGQVFACLGFVEAAIALFGEAEGAFDWREPTVRFHLRAPGDRSPVVRVLEFLDRANAVAAAPGGSSSFDDWKGAWGEKPRAVPRVSGYPFPDPPSPATLPRDPEMPPPAHPARRPSGAGGRVATSRPPGGR